MERFQVKATSRHIRHVFFIDTSCGYEKLLSLIHANLKLWGGRFNPIVLMEGDMVSDAWQSVLKFYDPDYVYYSEKVDPDVIKGLRIFNPIKYLCLDDASNSIGGLNSFHFLSNFNDSDNLILTHNTWEKDDSLLEYYETNFGLVSGLYDIEDKLSGRLKRKFVGADEFDHLHRLFRELKPINQCALSKEKISTAVLRSENYGWNNQFEIVVAKDKSSTSDLLYFWNRMLFELRSIVYVTVEQLETLSQDEHFAPMLGDLDYEKTIVVTSQSLNEQEIQQIIDVEFKRLKSLKRFEYRSSSNFPFEVMDDRGYRPQSSGEKSHVQELISNRGLLRLPKLSFAENISYNSQEWIVDIEVTQKKSGRHEELLFPLTTDINNVVQYQKGRVNKLRTLSILVDETKILEALEMQIPNFETLSRQLITRPVIDGESQAVRFLELRNHDDSNRLRAFLGKFNFALQNIDEVFSDKNWVSIIEELAQSKKMAGDSITLDQVLKKCREALSDEGIVTLDENGLIVGKKTETHKNDENLVHGVKNAIAELCDYGLLLMGFILKCQKCSSKFWYSINDSKEQVICKGCLDLFKMPIEPNFAYKLNDLVKNNMFHPDGSRAGNLTVIKTIVSMYNGSGRSFFYSPQVNVYDDYHSNRPCCELDILCIADGKLVIGEAKHNSRGFFEKGGASLDSLVEISRIIRPDKVILTCYEDPNDKLSKAKQGLIHRFNKWKYQPEIEAWQLHEPDNFHLESYRYFYY